jgi:tetratricopeptide (TPR) repeat protein
MRIYLRRWYVIGICCFFLIIGCGKGIGVQRDAATVAKLSALNNLGVAYMEQHSYAKAAEEFQKMVALDERYSDGHINLGIAYFNLGKYEEAERELKRGLELKKDQPNASFVLGLIAKARGDYAPAVEYFQRVLRKDPDDPHTHYNLGVCLSKLGRHEEAINEYRAVLSRDSSNLSARYNLAQELMRLGRQSEAAQELEAFNRLKGEGALSTSVGLRYLEQGKYAEIVESGELTGGREEAGVEMTLADITGEVGLGMIGLMPGTTPAIGDYDKDGDVDICIPGKSHEGKERLYLLQNDGHESGGSARWADGGVVFTDVAVRAGIAELGDTFTFTAAFGDYDNDGNRDLYLFNNGKNLLYRNGGDGTFADVTDAAGVGGVSQSPRGTFADISVGGAWADVDHDGDLDTYVVNSKGYNRLYRNNGNGSFTDITKEAGVEGSVDGQSVVFTDFDNDRDIDFYVVNTKNPNMLYSNNRDGTFTDVAKEAGVAVSGGGEATFGDYNNDGFMDLYVAGVLYKNNGDKTFTVVNREVDLPEISAGTASLTPRWLDIDNDGDLDLLTPDGNILGSDGNRRFGRMKAAIQPPKRGGVVIPADFNGDGGIDLLVAGYDGTLKLFESRGAEKNHWIRVRLTGLNSNRDGIGTKLEVKAGLLYQKYEVRGGSSDAGEMIVGLGPHEKADLVRVLWPGGVRQTEIDVPAGTTLDLTELDRKGTSCPLLYVWDGEEYRFLTDILGGAIIGYLVRPSTYNIPDTDEYVPIDGDLLKAKDGIYPTRIANQLEEVIYLDQAELVAIDHPEGTVVYPNERLLSNPPYPPFGVFTLDEVRPLRAAVDDSGRSILKEVQSIDRIYPEGFRTLMPRFQGYAEMHTITLDLGDLDGATRVVFLAYGWAEYAHSTSNVAAAQAGLTLVPPRLEVRDGERGSGGAKETKGGGWRTVVEDLGFPAGLPKWMAVDITEITRAGHHIVRIATSMPVYWDRIAVGLAHQEHPFLISRIKPEMADLHYVGYPKILFPDGEKPEIYDYQKRMDDPLWGDHIGGYTRYGDVRELLVERDDRYIVMFHGDEVTLGFREDAFPPLRPGWRRDFLLYADGFGKDMDLHSAFSATVDPLPFHSMSGYPYGPNEHYPDDEEYVRYLLEYNTRYVAARGDHKVRRKSYGENHQDHRD